MPPAGPNAPLTPTSDIHRGRIWHQQLGFLCSFTHGIVQTFFHRCEQKGNEVAISPEKKNIHHLSTVEKVSSRFQEIRFIFKPKAEQFVQTVGVKWERTPRCAIGGRPFPGAEALCLSAMKNPAKTGQRTEVSLVNDRSGEQEGRRGTQRRDM